MSRNVDCVTKTTRDAARERAEMRAAALALGHIDRFFSCYIIFPHKKASICTGLRSDGIAGRQRFNTCI